MHYCPICKEACQCPQGESDTGTQPYHLYPFECACCEDPDSDDLNSLDLEDMLANLFRAADRPDKTPKP